MITILDDTMCIGHPLREDVSWNDYVTTNGKDVDVILFVRMWVEIGQVDITYQAFTSSSSWGCELKYAVTDNKFLFHLRHPLREDVSWNISPFLTLLIKRSHPLREDVSWNTKPNFWSWIKRCHPLREDVSWNTFSFLPVFHLTLSSSSWGCELK